MHSTFCIQAVKAWGWLALSLPSLGLLHIGSAQAFSIAPLRIEANRGQLQIGNPSDRTIKVQLQVFSPRQVGGIDTAGLKPLADEQADQWVQFRPSIFRIGPGASRTVPYRIVTPTQPFYICGTTLQSIFNVRVCSRWVPSASSSASARPMP